MINRILLIAIFLLGVLVVYAASFSQSTDNLAPGAPGKDAQWTSAGKDGIGTSNTLESKVWFTLRDGAMTEVYYPTVDVANTRMLQLLVVEGTRVEQESEDTLHRLEVPDPTSLTFRQVNVAKSGHYTIEKTYIADPRRSTVLIQVKFQPKTSCRLYVYYDPSLNNSGMHDSAWSEAAGLLAADADKASALISSSGLEEMTNGYYGTSDGLTQLEQSGRIARPYVRAADGNVVQVARLDAAAGLTLALGFGREPEEALKNARESLADGFEPLHVAYEEGWRQYVSSLRRVESRYEREFEMAAMVLRAHEDKTYRGAIIASLTVPWGGGSNANEPNVGGYHLVWSRDLYQVATALYALGDKAGADRALNYLFTVQQKPDGSFPQNSWLDGRPFWGSLQMDEVAFPLILAYQLGRTDNKTWTQHVKPAADFIVRNGPATPQERWEEKAGYSPSTIAAEIAGLVCAAEIARRNNDQESANSYLTIADNWRGQVEKWTVTATGSQHERRYFLRISSTGDPNRGSCLDAGNGGGVYDEREIVDAGFLELVRLGIMAANDPAVVESLKVVDRLLLVQTPSGPAWYRYNHDGYGEKADGLPWDGTGVGRLWTLLTGERGEYELARGDREAAGKRLDAMLAFANEGGMIPEQVWDRPEASEGRFQFGKGTGSATPLAWSMAQFIRLAVNAGAGRNLETPDIVAARYLGRAGK